MGTILREAKADDALTLWHLLSRIPAGKEREKIFDVLAVSVKLPKNASRGSVLQLNKEMLDAWWLEIQSARY